MIIKEQRISCPLKSSRVTEWLSIEKRVEPLTCNSKRIWLGSFLVFSFFILWIFDLVFSCFQWPQTGGSDGSVGRTGLRNHFESVVFLFSLLLLLSSFLVLCYVFCVLCCGYIPDIPMGGRMPPTASRMASLPHTSAPGVTHIYPVTTRGLIAERGEPVTHTHTHTTDKKR
jgi:hypothetical protein